MSKTDTKWLDSGSENIERIIKSDGSGGVVFGGAFTQGASFPGSPVTGDLHYDTDDEKLYSYVDPPGAWLQTTGSGSTGITSIDDNGTATAMTIDSSQNVLMGKTTNVTATPGFSFDGNRVFITTDSSESLFLQRKTTDGDMISFAKDGIPKAAMGLASSALTLSTAGSEAMRIDSSQRVFMGKTVTGNSVAGFEWDEVSERVIITGTTAGNQGVFSTLSNASYSGIGHQIRMNRANTSAYDFIYTESSGGVDIEHRLKGDGNGTCDGAWTGGGADRAEYMEWDDGNPLDEDRRGFTVVNIGNQKIRQATQADKDAGTKIFPISSNPDSIGNAAEFRWKDKYLRDDFGSYLREDYTTTSWTEAVVDGDDIPHSYETDKIPGGLTVPSNAVVVGETGKGGRKIPNPSFVEQAYTSREDRKEWSMVAMSGFTRVKTDQIIPDKWIEQSTISASIKEYLVF